MVVARAGVNASVGVMQRFPRHVGFLVFLRVILIHSSLEIRDERYAIVPSVENVKFANRTANQA